MAISVKKISIWRTETMDEPGMLARSLEPIAAAGGNLKIVMGYRYPGGDRAAIEVFPISGKKLIASAQSSGLGPVTMPTLVVEGDDRPGLGHAIARALGDAGINISFLVTQVIGRKFSAVFGFPADVDIARATALIRKAAAPPPRASRARPRKRR